MTIQVINLSKLKVNSETLAALDLLAKWQSVPRSQVIRRILDDGAHQAKIEHVARLYGHGEITLARAAEIADVTIYEMMAHVRAHGISAPGDLTELRADIADTLIRLGRTDIATRLATHQVETD